MTVKNWEEWKVDSRTGNDDKVFMRQEIAERRLQVKDLTEKLKLIEEVLASFVNDRTGIVTEIILQIQGKTGDETFVCNPVDLYFDK